MLWWIAVTVFSFFIKGLCGFANTLVFTSLLSFTNNNVNISPVELVLGYPTNVIVAWKERRWIRWQLCVPLSVLIILGSIPGILFLKNADTTVIKILFGFVIIGIGGQMLWQEKHAKPVRQSKVALAVIGVLSGVLCGLYGVGALLGAYMGKITENSHSFKGNLCMVFWVESTMRILLYLHWGIISLEVLGFAVKLVPFMILGLVLGMVSSSLLDEKVVRKVVIVMLIFSGAALIVNSL